MTASIPSGFSSDDLEKMLENAMPEPETSDDSVSEQEHIEAVVDAALESMSEESPGPVAHKVAMMQICYNMFAWHNHMAEMNMKEGDFDSAACWSRDAGHFQVIHNILANISVGHDDFTCRQDEE